MSNGKTEQNQKKKKKMKKKKIGVKKKTAAKKYSKKILNNGAYQHQSHMLTLPSQIFKCSS